MRYIPYGRQDICENDIDVVVQTLRSDFLTQGPAVPLFEKSLVNYCKSKFAVVVNSATSALHLACRALDIGEGDIVWTTPMSFVASANCARYCGALIDFVDIDPRTYNLCPKKLLLKLQKAEKDGSLPKAVIPVHFAGQSCEMEEIHFLSKKYGFRIIEDASHAIGGGYKKERIGNCKYSDITVFSFHPVKIITTGEGGAALTNNRDLAQKMALLRSHGITRNQDEMEGKLDAPWYYQQVDLGYNYRMTDIQAALGISQMKRLNDYVSSRNALAKRYEKQLKDFPVETSWQHPDCYSAMHLYVIRLVEGRTQSCRREVFEYMRNNKIGVNVHYIPIHLQPYYRRLGFSPGQFPNAEQYYSEAITLPLYPTLHDNELERVVETLSGALSL